MKLGLGGSPTGPAGTGKTESVKALGAILGRLVLVFNCDEGKNATFTSYKSISSNSNQTTTQRYLYTSSLLFQLTFPANIREERISISVFLLNPVKGISFQTFRGLCKHSYTALGNDLLLTYPPSSNNHIRHDCTIFKYTYISDGSPIRIFSNAELDKNTPISTQKYSFITAIDKIINIENKNLKLHLSQNW